MKQVTVKAKIESEREVSAEAGVMPLGSYVSCHHMPESYYEKWERLRRRERQLYRRAIDSGCDCGAWHKWQTASKELVSHEQEHSTQ